MAVPPSVVDYNVRNQNGTVIKQKSVPNYDKALYETRRIEVKAYDGAIVPVSLVYRKDLVTVGTPAPLHLYGYGSYGLCMDPSFSVKRLPMLNRGMIYAIAHIRGGQEMGRAWYDQGKCMQKQNTFTDFIACAEALHEGGWSEPSLTSIEGRSGGGLLMGCVVNMRPDLFKVAIAGVPFVDVMTTMCDASIPLVVGDWPEFGNPNEARYFNYMRQYSPIDNVIAQDYPAILVLAGLHDPRVAYWEPMKWVATLREHKTDDAPLLLKVDIEAGHFSASDRYQYLNELAFELSFVFDQLGLEGTTPG